MPLAPRYSWSETELDVSIQLHSLSLKDQGQLLCGDSFVKISAAPYFLLLDLFSEVDECSSHATIQGSTLILKLRKVRSLQQSRHGWHSTPRTCLSTDCCCRLSYVARM